jgi:hypothetical protein
MTVIYKTLGLWCPRAHSVYFRFYCVHVHTASSTPVFRGGRAVQRLGVLSCDFLVLFVLILSPVQCYQCTWIVYFSLRFIYFLCVILVIMLDRSYTYTKQNKTDKQ